MQTRIARLILGLAVMAFTLAVPFTPVSAQTPASAAPDAAASSAPINQATTNAQANQPGSSPVAPGSATATAVAPGGAPSYSFSVSLQPGSRINLDQPLHVDVESVPATAGDVAVWAKYTFAIAALVIALIAAMITMLVGLRNWQAARINLLNTCHKTYGEIFIELYDLSERQRLAPFVGAPDPKWAAEAITAKKLFIRLWNLQYEEFVYFYHGQLIKRVFENWLTYRFKDFRNPAFVLDFGVEKVSYLTSWNDRKRELGPGHFVTFMEKAAGFPAAALPAGEVVLAPAGDPDGESKAATSVAMVWFRENKSEIRGGFLSIVGQLFNS